VFRSSAVLRCFACHSIHLRYVVFSSIINCMFRCIVFRHRSLLSFSLAYQFQSVQFCHTLFHLLSTFLLQSVFVVYVFLTFLLISEKWFFEINFRTFNSKEPIRIILTSIIFPSLKNSLVSVKHNNIYLFHFDNTFQSMNHYQAILTKFRIRCI